MASLHAVSGVASERTRSVACHVNRIATMDPTMRSARADVPFTNTNTSPGTPIAQR